MTGPIELMVMAFDDEKQAAEALKELKKHQRYGSFRLFNTAILKKSPTGRTTLEEVDDVDAKRGSLFGAIVGGLIGLLGGPAGVIVGAAAGAATGGVAANRIDLGFSKEFLSDLRDALKPGSSAILVLVERAWADQVAGELEKFTGQLLRHAVKAEVLERLRENPGG